MSRIPHPRRLRRKTIAGLCAAAFLATASLAVAQVVDLPDDGPNQQGQPITLNCGPQVLNTIKTSVQGSFTNATNFTLLQGARLPEVEVPDGATRCVKVLFTAETACEDSAASDFCYIRAVAVDANGVVHPLDPQGGGFQAMDSEDDTASAHAYEWVKRLEEGEYEIRIERRVGNAMTQYWTDDWTFDVEVHL
jgi:hypothetical protein